MQLPAPADVIAAFADAYDGITEVVRDLGELDLLLPSRCRGWTICDLLLHVTLDAQRALIAFATSAAGPADVDFVDYWRAFPGDPDATAANAQWVRRSAGAFERPSGVLRIWSETAPAAVRAATAADPMGRVSTQEHILTVPDFIATLITEAVIHHLDLTVSLPGAPGPAPAAAAIARQTLEGLAALPEHWDEHEALLKATGRTPLNPADRHVLGDRADLFPLLG